MTPAERAKYHVDGIRMRADTFDEPLRSELIAITVALHEMLACFREPAKANLPETPILDYPTHEMPRTYDEALGPRWTQTK